MSATTCCESSLRIAYRLHEVGKFHSVDAPEPTPEPYHGSTHASPRLNYWLRITEHGNAQRARPEVEDSRGGVHHRVLQPEVVIGHALAVDGGYTAR